MHSLDALCASLKQEFDSARLIEAQTARTALGSELNEFLRRLRSYKGEREWTAIVLDGVALFCERSALFQIGNGAWLLRGMRGIELAPDLTYNEPLPRAFEAAVRSKDAVVALRTEAEVGSALAAPGVDRALLLPVLNEERVVALLALLGATDIAVPGLELIAGLAGMVLERRSNTGHKLAIQPAVDSALPAWAQLDEAARATHVRAQRFARVRVAEMQLAHTDAANAGREQRDLYLFLKEQIDAARDSYRSQFMTDRNMLDYLHLELVRALAGGDENRLGDEYPGPLQ